MLRRAFAGALGMLVCLGSIPAAAQDEYPNRPIKIVVPYAPGGASDTLARAVADSMTKTLGQSTIVENRPGASGTTGSDLVARSAPDGYTIVMGTSASHSLNTVVFPQTYDPVTAFAPIALVTRVPNLIFVARSLPVQNIQQLIAHLKANPGTPVAVGGPATSGRFAAELFSARLGVQLTVVPYGGSTPAMADVRAGHVQIGITDLLSPIPFVKAGDLRAIAVTGLGRAPSLPQVPTVAETVSPGFEAVAWNALFAPPRTPAPVIAKLNAAVRKTFESAETRQRFEALGQEIAAGSPTELTQFMKDDIARWKALAASSKLTF